ncbi:hypothetical protein COV20_02035 [Candidatus Woesearchaeota archaeon CG10_big_fil_rev_8_21_14_0_10_45_16]|nr:MAG: hypothetical protein COV20_02035 [Candidatus Woesearchaeota archaeon CG10_big_fil_rev_8_21_14_0_10_45_16]
MLYIHKFSDLTRRVAEAESISLVRDFRQKLKPPVNQEQFKEFFQNCVVSDSGIMEMEQARKILEPVFQKAQSLLLERNPLHEPISLQRFIRSLQTVPAALDANIAFAKEMRDQLPVLLQTAPQLFSRIRTAQTREEKMQVDRDLNQMFQGLLRNTEFHFKADDLINEGHVEMIKSLTEGMERGFFFHVTLEEEIKKLPFQHIKSRIPAERLNEAAELEMDLQLIRKGIMRAYDNNMKAIETAVLLYSGVKWAMS